PDDARRADGGRGDDAVWLSRQARGTRPHPSHDRSDGPPRQARASDRLSQRRARPHPRNRADGAAACRGDDVGGGVEHAAVAAQARPRRPPPGPRGGEEGRGRMDVLGQPPAAEARPVMSERRASLICALIVMIGPISMALYTPAMPRLVEAFGTTEAMVKLTLSLYFAGFAVTQIVCGPLSDGFGRKPVTFAFMAIYLVASIAAVFAPTIEVLIAARFFQGVGAAVGTTVSRALVRDLFT